MVAIPRLTVRTEYGSVLAVPHRGVLLFRNVPFAAPPFGARRFLPPQPPAVWDGLRDGAEPGVGMPQPIYNGPLDRYYDPKRQGEDALTVEVQTPELGRTGMPVMVWFHAGGFFKGAGSAQANDGYAFARDGIVHVSVNSRLGLDGYTLLRDSEANHADNLGLRDQIAALHWVQRNIAQFGGDPAQVTIAGQSTGASSVSYLLASPAAKGLFHRAISQSGSSASWMTTDEARGIADLIARQTGRAPTSAAMRDLDFDGTRAVTLGAMAAVYADAESWNMVGRLPLPFCGVIGTETLPDTPVRLIAQGAAEGVPILGGTTKDETTAFMSQQFPDLRIDSPAGRQMLFALGADASTVERFRATLECTATDLAVVCAIATDVWARKPTTDMLAAHGGTDFLYEFTWESPFLEPGAGAVQGMDLPFSQDDFENLNDVPRGKSMLGKSPSEELATDMHTAFVDFIATGDPGWDAWRSDDPVVRRFDATESLSSAGRPALVN
jgi:carboxylesterase type B